MADGSKTRPRTEGRWQSYFGEILDGVADGITIVGEDCRLEYANKAAERIFGMDRDRLIGRRCDDPALGLSAPPGSPSPEERLARCRGLKTGESLPPVEMTVRGRHGTALSVLAGSAPLRDEDGRFVGVIDSYADITERKRTEVTLRGSEERFRHFIETAQEGVLAQDARFRTTFVNGEMTRMLGYRSEDMVGRPVMDFVHVEDRKTFREQMRARRAGEPGRYEMRMVAADGTPVWVRVSATPLVDESGRFAGAFGMLTDITEAKEAERVRRENEEYNASLLRLYELLGRADSYSTILAALLTEIPKTLGYAGVGLGVMQEDGESVMMLDVQGDTMRKAIEDILQLGGRYRVETPTGKAVRLPVKGDPMMEELAEGTHIVVLADALTDPRANKEIVNAVRQRTLIAVPLVLAGRILGMLVMGTFGDEGVRTPSPRQLDYLSTLANHVAVAMDRVRVLDERKRSEESLWESSQMLKLVLDNMPAFVFWKDRDSVYLGCNKLFAANAGLSSPEAIVGLTDLDLPWRDTEAEGYRADDRTVMEAGVPKLDYEETQLTADGRVTDVRTSKIPLRSPEGDVIGVLGTFEDITERKRAEKGLRESEARLQGIISNTNAAVHLSDSAGRLMLVNRQFAKLLGVTEKHAVGKTVRELAPSAETAQALEEREQRVRETGRSLQVEETVPTTAGMRSFVSLTFPLLDASGSVYAVGGISTDITQIKLAEDELRKKDLAIRRAYVDVIAAVTGNKLILMTPDEIEETLGEPLGDSRRISSYKPLSVARAEIRETIEQRVPGAGNVDGFIVGVGEALTNAIKHGGGGRYQVRRRNGIAQVVISDKGPGVDFTTVPRATLEVGFSTSGTLGMGFAIMLEMSDRVLLSTQPGTTILVLELKR